MYKFAEKLEALTGKTSKAKKKQRDWGAYVLPTLGAASAGVGAAGLGAAYGIANDAHADFVQKKLNTVAAPTRVPGDTDLTHYADVMAAAASLRPFGVPAGEAMTQLRSSPEIMAKAKIRPDYLTDTPLKLLQARAHYDSFKKGPAAAYFHMIHPQVRGLPEGVRPAFDEAWRKFTGEEFDAPTGGYIDPHDIDTTIFPHDRQVRFLRKFHNDLPQPLQDALQKYESAAGRGGDALQKQMANYTAPAQGVLAARDKLKNIGITATGATAGGALGYYLHQALAGAKQKKGLTPTKLLSTLGGAGLGGLAAYYGGTGAGRQTVLTKLLAKLPG